MNFSKLIQIAAICLCCGCNGYKYQEDNLAEESAELAIKVETGVDIDLSPSTPETGFSPKSLAPISSDDIAIES